MLLPLTYICRVASFCVLGFYFKRRLSVLLIILDQQLHVGSHDLNQEYTMKISQESTIITKVDSEKYLDVTVDKSLRFTGHVDNKIKLANRNLGLIFRTFTFLDKEIFLSQGLS